VDVWSLGCITYILLTGTPAFKGSTEEEVKKYIIESEVEYPDELWGDISPEAKDFCI
jgi:serine/threonine protein kinase